MNYDVVFHVDALDENILALALSNILNFYKAPQSVNAKAVLLVNGPAVKMFLKGKTPKELDLALENGLILTLCQNALTKFEINREDLVSNHEVTPAGIIELIDLQNAGFSYIKP